MNKVYIFDIDDTLINTMACVKVVNTNGDVIYELNSQGYNHRTRKMNTSNLLHPGLKFDFSEFRSLERLLQEGKRKPFDTFRQLASQVPGDVYIITAREDSNLIHTWLKEEGIDIPIENIFTNELTGQPLGEWKTDKMMKIVAKYDGLTHVSVWEDDEDCRECMKGQESRVSRLTVTLEAI